MESGEMSLQVRHVPPDVHAILRKRAAAEGKSLQEYLLTLLVTQARRPTLAEALDRAGSHSGGRIGLREAVDEVRALRDSG